MLQRHGLDRVGFPSSKPSGCAGRPNLLRMNVDPGLRNPTAIFTIGVKRISEVTETMLGPAVFVIVNALLKKGGIAVFIA
jgi:hypothetical protein